MYRRAKEKKRGRKGERASGTGKNAAEPERTMMEARVSSRGVERVFDGIEDI